VRRITVLLAYVLLHGGRSEYGLWLPHISLGLGKTNNDSDVAEGPPPLGELAAPDSVDSGRGRLYFQLMTAFYRYGDEGLGMQPGRA
jgi:hypothetical protein